MECWFVGWLLRELTLDPLGSLWPAKSDMGFVSLKNQQITACIQSLESEDPCRSNVLVAACHCQQILVAGGGYELLQL